MVRTLFMGSPDFAVPSLRALVGAGHSVVGVITQPDRAAGRGGRLAEPPVKPVARELSIPVFQPESMREPETVELIAGLRPRVVVVAAYGEILPRAVLAIPTRGSLNVHASLLPRWRGASPVAAAIRAGDAETGVSIMEVVRKMDAGPVVSRASLPIERDSTTGTLEPRLADLGAELLVETLPDWEQGAIEPVPQDDESATYCHILQKKDAHLSADLTATEAERAVRAYDPWPGAHVLYRDQRLALWRGHVAPRQAAPGSTHVVDGLPAIAFRDGLL
ncbi:MAG: methionyl-tRNA formyltransferase, partial [Dehalococcoidia bacterium]